MSSHQTENTYFKEKVKLRLDALPNRPLKVLDCFSADGKIWDAIKTHRSNITVLRIEKEKNKSGIYLRGDNLKFLKNIDLEQFDIIDLDAFGIPFKQLEIIFQRVKTEKIIFVTFIQSMFGGLPNKMLYCLGYTMRMVKKCPTLFYNNGFNKFCNWLYLNNIRVISLYNIKNKYYIKFKTNGERQCQ